MPEEHLHVKLAVLSRGEYLKSDCTEPIAMLTHPLFTSPDYGASVTAILTPQTCAREIDPPLEFVHTRNGGPPHNIDKPMVRAARYPCFLGIAFHLICPFPCPASVLREPQLLS